MERVAGIGGFFYRAADVDALRNWYADNLGVDISAGAWFQAAGPTVFTPFAETDAYFASDRRWMINFRVADLDKMIAQLEAADIEVATDPDWNSHIGRFARIHDPEGNPIELWEPAGPAAADAPPSP